MPSLTSRTDRGTDYLLGILSLLLAGLLLYWTGRFLLPVRLPPAPSGSYHLIAAMNDIPDGSALPFEMEDQPWLLIKTGGDISAVSGYCTFRGSRVLWDPEARVVRCQGHSCLFTHRGDIIHGLATRPLEALKIRIIGDRIYGARQRS